MSTTAMIVTIATHVKHSPKYIKVGCQHWMAEVRSPAASITLQLWNFQGLKRKISQLDNQWSSLRLASGIPELVPWGTTTLSSVFGNVLLSKSAVILQLFKELPQILLNKKKSWNVGFLGPEIETLKDVKGLIEPQKAQKAQKEPNKAERAYKESQKALKVGDSP